MYRAFQDVSKVDDNDQLQKIHANRLLNRLWANAADAFGPRGSRVKLPFPPDIQSLEWFGVESSQSGDLFHFEVTYTGTNAGKKGRAKDKEISSFCLSLTPRDIAMMAHCYDHKNNPQALEVLQSVMTKHFTDAMIQELQDRQANRPTSPQVRQALNWMRAL